MTSALSVSLSVRDLRAVRVTRVGVFQEFCAVLPADEQRQETGSDEGAASQDEGNLIGHRLLVENTCSVHKAMLKVGLWRLSIVIT